MQDFRNLRVWQKAHKLTLKTYALSATMSHPRTFNIRDQLVRSAISVPANIAEGCGRAGDRDFRRFLRHSLGSACELEYHLLLIRDLGLLTEAAHRPLEADLVEIKRMLAGLIRRLVTDSRTTS
jgi:four helix bundle protein